MKTFITRISAAFLIGTSLIVLPVHAQTPSPTATPMFDEAQLTAFFESLTEVSFTTLPAAVNGKVSLQVGAGLVVAFPAESGLSFNGILYTDDLYLQCEQLTETDGITNVIIVCKAIKAGNTDITITELNADSTPKAQPWKKIAVAIMNDPTSPTTTEASLFVDVPTAHRHLSAINHLKTIEAIGGYPDGTFKPDIKINRAEFAKIIMEVLGKTTDARRCFTDVKTEWFAPYVCAAKENGIISGYPDGSFGPGKSINFAEAVKIAVLAFSDMTAADFAASGGAAWYTPYLAYANANGSLTLIDHLIVTPSVAVTRGQIAQLISNMLP